ncbi:MAG: hypothetical protein LBC94_02355 [Desulfovibrio sp.]|jgi:hypothetical protein|nr:hypothetical protein [Desulfovibrio sp.]
MIFDSSILNTVVLAFVGGLFGASLGGLWVFVLDALLVLLGCIVVLAGGSDFLLLQIALGPLFGPQSTFLGGSIAASYAAGIRKNHPGGSGRDIISPLLDTSWDVLLVGGAGAVVCALLATAAPHIPVLNRTDTLAGPIIIVAIIGRFLFHREGPCGKLASIKKLGLLGTDDYKISWVPWMAQPSRLLIVGASVGGISGAVAMFCQQTLQPMVEAGRVAAVTAHIVPYIFFWGVSGIMLTAMQLGKGATQKIPITHGMAVLGAAAYLSSHSLVIAILGGIFGAFLEELCARCFINHASDHVDPPAFAITLGVLAYSFIPW